ncbi:MAG: 8-amino-7-oxononanoate synthase [Puniceicoccales bacterium]|jgi:8-amino-7-oxononanoate synthase|nr:8-amino-7-oxononanoate synthase [Puniceicoccales bacterium]
MVGVAIEMNAASQMVSNYTNYLAKLEKSGLLRSLKAQHQGGLDFSSNDYLGLANSPALLEAGYEAARLYGSGSTGSRLLSGNSDLFEDFEAQIAKDYGTETALLFNSGFDANIGIIPAISDKTSLIIFDKLNHASLYQGALLSGAKLLRYNHLDYTMLGEILKKNINNHGTIIIASETVFGMDGDRANLKILADLSSNYNAILYLDEAHAIGLQGKNGYGLSTDFDLDKNRTIILGTLSKALGSTGAYVACNSLIKNMLINKCQSFIYSTALAPFCIGAAARAWKIAKTMTKERRALIETSTRLKNYLKDLGYNVLGNGTNIIPVLFNGPNEVMKKKEDLCKNGLLVSALRRPTVAKPRLRIAVNARHTQNDITKLLSAFS